MAQKIKKASTSDTMAEALASVNAKKVNEWKRFLEIAQEQKTRETGIKVCRYSLTLRSRRRLKS